MMGNPAKKKHIKLKEIQEELKLWKMSIPGIVECPQCHEMKLAHRVCKKCGYYKG